MKTTFQPKALRSTLVGLALVAGLVSSNTALAGELKFGEGAESLAVDDEGKLTAEGKKTILTQLDKVPGEDAWDLKFWGRFDRGAEGPLYFEFSHVYNGKRLELGFRHEDPNYDGSKYYSGSIYLEGNDGFNKNTTYTIKAVQFVGEDKKQKLAEGKVKLINTGRKPEPSSGPTADEAEADEMADQDAYDTLAGPDDAESPDAAPPEIDDSPAKKKGCAVHEGSGSEGALLALFGLAFVLRRRRV